MMYFLLLISVKANVRKGDEEVRSLSSIKIESLRHGAIICGRSTQQIQWILRLKHWPLLIL